MTRSARRRLKADLFAGGGGASKAIEAATGEPVDIAINHSDVAIRVHARNHPRTRHYTADVYEVDPLEATGGEPLDLLWASPDCTDHSYAKGGMPRSNDKRCLADVVPTWLEATRARLLFLENVREFLQWGPLDSHGRVIKSRRGEEFKRWRSEIEALGYDFEYRILDASEYGAPTRRRRLFVVARNDGKPIRWPEPTHGAGLLPFHTAAECIDWSIPCPSIFERKRPLCDKTLWRIAQGILRFVLRNPRPFIVKVNHGKWEPRHESIDEPLSTITAARRGHALVAPTLVQTGYGERVGQSPRVLDLHKPLTTVVACGQKHGLVSAFLAKHYGDPLRSDGGGGRVIGSELDRPIGTITTRDHHSLAAITLAKFRGTSDQHPGCASIDEPLDTISAGGDRGGVHFAEVRAFLTAYYGSDGTSGQDLNDPMRTITTRDRLGLVTIEGTEFQISDIGFRMLQPHELLRAQFGRYAEGYDLSEARTKAEQVELVGNSVCPEVAEAVIRANY